MRDLVIERHYNTDAATLFAFLTEVEHIPKWWCPEGVSVVKETMIFDQQGPWTVTMRGDDTGELHKVSGKIIEFNPPHRLRYTWGWHDDDDDVRGHESEVSFHIKPDGNGVTLTMRHIGLESEESLENHRNGWESTMTKLDRIFA